MRKFLSFSLILASLFGFIIFELAPLAAEAKTPPKKHPIVRHLKRHAPLKRRVKIQYRDEGLLSGNATSSRCLTKAMQNMYAQALRQMDRDVLSAGAVSSTSALAYRNKLDTIWTAMAEPYCGRGSRGLSAVRHSFQKSVGKTRDAFFRDWKKEQAATVTIGATSSTQ